MEPMNTATSDKKDLIMSNVIPFPNCRPLTKLEQRAILRARYFDDGNWSMKDGRPHIVLEAEIGMTSCRWVAVYRKRGGGFVWEGGDTDVRDGSDVVLGLRGRSTPPGTRRGARRGPRRLGRSSASAT